MVAYGPRHLAPIPNLNWHLVLGREKGAKPREAVIEANTINAIMKTAEAGLGIAGLPDYVARENENLVRVLPDIDGPAFETFFVYPEELKGSRRVIAFREFLIEEVKRWEQ
jgi:DNA-binding transcriptional LysR family regulator